MPASLAPNSGAPEPGRTPAAPESSRGRVLRLALALAGLVLFVFVLRSVGWREVSANLARVGPGLFAGLVALYSLAQLSFAMGWWLLIEPRLSAARFPRFFGVYLAGDAANLLAPGGVAGEPLRVHLLRSEIGGAAALAGVTIFKHSDMFAQCAYMAVGVAVGVARFPIPAPIRAAAIGSTAFFAFALVILSVILPNRTYSPLFRRLARWKLLARPLARVQSAAERTDARMSFFYRAHPGRFLVSSLWCLAGWCGGLLETRILLHFLAPEAGWAHAVAIEGLAMTLNNLFLFVPARLGSAEGVRVAVFLLVGLPAAAGAAYGLLRRGREVVWLIPGLAALLQKPSESAPDLHGDSRP